MNLTPGRRGYRKWDPREDQIVRAHADNVYRGMSSYYKAIKDCKQEHLPGRSDEGIRARLRMFVEEMKRAEGIPEGCPHRRRKAPADPHDQELRRQ